MCCSVGENGEVNGLFKSHAYTLIGAYEYKGTRLVKIRNPHGSGEWTGDWNDNDLKWTNDMKSKCKF